MAIYSVTREPNSYVGVGWSNLDNLKVSDDQYASIIISSKVTKDLILYDFGFAIPSNAIINGISVSIEAHANIADALYISAVYLGFFNKLKLITKGSTRENITTWTTTDDIYTVGSSSDLWDTTWTYDDINQSSFGCQITIYNNSSYAAYAYVDYVNMTITYTISGTTYQLSASIPLQTTFTPLLNVSKKISSLVSCRTSLNGILKRFAGLKASIPCSTLTSSFIAIQKKLQAVVQSSTSITSSFISIRKKLQAVVQSSTSIISDLIVRGKQLLNAVISTSTTFLSSLKVNYTLNSVFVGKTQVSSFASIKKALQSSINGRTLFTGTINRVKHLVSNITTKTILTAQLIVPKLLSVIISGKTSFVSQTRIIRNFASKVVGKTTIQAQLISVQLLNAVISSATQMKASLKKTIRMFASFAGKTIFISIPTFWSRVKIIAVPTFWSRIKMYPATWQQKNREVKTWKRIK